MKAPHQIGSGNYVTLGLAGQLFAVDVAYVREVLENRPLTCLPNAAAFLIGMLDVRGTTVPVVDLRRRLGMPDLDATENARIMVLEMMIHGKHVVVGLRADEVFEVIEFGSTSLEVPPDVGDGWDSSYIQAISRWEDRFVIILDMTRLFNLDEMTHLRAFS